MHHSPVEDSRVLVKLQRKADNLNLLEHQQQCTKSTGKQVKEAQVKLERGFVKMMVMWAGKKTWIV